MRRVGVVGFDMYVKRVGNAEAKENVIYVYAGIMLNTPCTVCI
jgi:hypothetical protein